MTPQRAIRCSTDAADFCDVQRGTPYARLKSSGMVRDTATDSRPPFVVDNATYLSVRWPGDTRLLLPCRRKSRGAAGFRVRWQHRSAATMSTGRSCWARR
ncbi:hypothetical protein BST12_20095 [Mycobacterium angelicum]|uniref:Uncharacterized protein n=1 Tax=Mycobacterium angelicum TaxID=470074 RepID=A0A1W9ZJT2_MYCAN|nr:hypothetical protein BST12_20095 [Mycobacterium angelicum]